VPISVLDDGNVGVTMTAEVHPKNGGLFQGVTYLGVTMAAEVQPQNGGHFKGVTSFTMWHGWVPE